MLISMPGFSSKQLINVHLQLSPKNHEVTRLINEFNTFLEQKKLLSHYGIKPYYPHFPLHITLFMTDFPMTNSQLIKERTQKLTAPWQTIKLTAQDFVVSPKGYVMLRLKSNPTIEHFANDLVTTLAPLRAPNPSIPSWAKPDPKRVALCNQYGSPNVFSYFDPHLSIFSADHLHPKQQMTLYNELQQALKEFTHTHNTDVAVYGASIGIGLADESGQITQELWSFNLNSPARG